MKTKQSLISNFRLFRQCLLLGFFLTPVMAVGQAPDFEEVRELASQDLAFAQYYLGFMYANGEGVPEDDAEAVKWYRLAADQGDAEQSLISNFRLFRQCLLLGFFLTPVTAVGQAPDFDFAGGQYSLGVMYANGEGVPEDDAEAVRWYRMAADQGHAKAQYNLGLMYGTGEGVSEDDAEAVKWYRLAADQGVAFAQNNLGNMYFNGEGVLKNYAEAVKWYRLAADQGVAAAQYNLGNMYYRGQGVPVNYVTAYAWWNIASASGNESAINNRALIEEKMTSAQIAEAQKLSTKIFDRIQQGN
jgi:TPR repeat protein